MCWMWKLSVEAFLPQTSFHDLENLRSAGYERSLSFPSSALERFLAVRFVPLHWLALPCDLLVVWESDHESKWMCQSCLKSKIQERRLGQASKMGKKLLVQWSNSGLGWGSAGKSQRGPRAGIDIEWLQDKMQAGIKCKVWF